MPGGTTRGRLARFRAGRRLLGAGIAVGALLAGALPAAAAPTEVRLSGSGWGHGVGFSQYGAMEQAKDGRTAQQILGHYYTGTATVMRTDAVLDQDVRVQVLGGVSSVTVRTLQLGGKGGAFFASAGGQRIDGRLGDTLTLELAGTGVRAVLRRAGTEVGRVEGPLVAVRWAGTRAMAGDATLLEVPGADGGHSAGQYRHGGLDVKQIGSRLNLVNMLRLNTEYLYGLGEMPAAWPQQALRSQAIAARTYALYNRPATLRAACDCHLYDEVTHQKFIGWKQEQHKAWRDAVDATVAAASRGQVQTYNGALIEALYSSSSGGRTQNSEDQFTSRVPYLRSVNDAWSTRASNPNRAWTATSNRAAVASAFGLPDVASLDLSRRTQAGAVGTAVATSSTGRTATLNGNQLRSRLGLRSSYVQRTASRRAGDDRYATAVAVGRSSAPSSRTVVLIGGHTANLVDGLVAAPLARQLGAPLLLTAPTALSAPTDAELKRRNVNRVVVVGGAGAVSAGVVRTLQARGITVERRSGNDRYATAAEVARSMRAGSAALFASGEPHALADAAAAGGAAAAAGRPILLVRQNSVPAQTMAVIRERGITASTCVGGAGVLSERVRTTLPRCHRASGSDRFATSVAVADAFSSLLTGPTATLAPGANANLVDAVTAGSLGNPVLLTSTQAPASVRSYLQRRLHVSGLEVVGGTAVVPGGVVTSLRRS